MTAALVASLMAQPGCAINHDQPASSPPSSTTQPSGTAGTSPTSSEAEVLAVASSDTTFDAGDRRGIPLRVWAPTTGGPYPVIVFSHGGGGSGQGYEYLVRAWAQHGYVVVLPTHAESIALQKQQGVGVREAVVAVKSAGSNPSAWAQRTIDVSAVLDGLDTLADRLPDLRGRIDSSYVGVAGHSFGAFTAMMVAGVEPDANGTTVDHRDSRPAGFVLLSPQGVGQNGLTATSFQLLDRPTLVMTGTLDEGQNTDTTTGARQTYQQKLDPFRLSPPGQKYSVVIDGASHFTFSGPGSAGALAPFLDQTDDTAPETYQAVIWATLRFWDHVLSPGRAAPGPALAPGDAPNAPTTVTVENR